MYVQTLLGHESIETTVIYTHLLTENIKRIYKTHHPRENKYYKELDSDYLKELSILKREYRNRRIIEIREVVNPYSQLFLFPILKPVVAM